VVENGKVDPFGFFGGWCGIAVHQSCRTMNVSILGVNGDGLREKQIAKRPSAFDTCFCGCGVVVCQNQTFSNFIVVSLLTLKVVKSTDKMLAQHKISQILKLG
jgi:hypothetical protein